MNKFEHYIVDLLQHHITFDDKEVQVRRQFNDIAQLPCITLSIADVSTEKVYAELGATEDMIPDLVKGTIVLSGGYKVLDAGEIEQIFRESF